MHWLHSSGQNSLCSYGFAFFLEKIDNEQVIYEGCSPRNVNQGWEIKSDGRGGVTFYHGWMSWVLLHGLQKVPKQLLNCLGFPLESSLLLKIGNWVSVSTVVHSISFYQPRF